MPRYFFNLRDGASYTPDDEGEDFPSVEAAREEAVASAREFLIACLAEGKPADSQVFEVSDAAGHVVATVPFDAVMKTIRN